MQGILSFAFSQTEGNFSFRLNTGERCSDALDAFEDRFKVFIAYNPDLSELKNSHDRLIYGSSKLSLFEKVCQIYQLEFLVKDKDKFLVRTGLKEALEKDFEVFHIQVTDPKASLPVAYASVYDEAGKIIGITDEFGDCFLKVPRESKDGKWFIHALGYKDFEIPEKAFVYNEVFLNVDPVVALPVFIKALRKKLYLNKTQAIDINKNLLQNISELSVFRNDVTRTLQLFPGINNTADHRSSIRIRGGAEEATMLILDHLPIFRADHYFGLFGAFNSQYISQAQIFKNNIPVNFGGRTSGLALLNSDTIRAAKKVSLDLHLIGAGVAAYLPISNHFLVKGAVRKTYMDLANPAFYDLTQRNNVLDQNSEGNSKNLIITRPSHNFEDINAGVRYSKGSLAVEANAFISSDRFKDAYTYSYVGRFQSLNKETYEQNSSWNNQAFGLHFTRNLKGHMIQGSAYQTSWNARYNNQNILSIKKGVVNIVNDTTDINNYNAIRDRGLKLDWSIPKYSQLLIGVEHIQHENEIYIENNRIPTFEINNKASETSVFAKTSHGKKEGLLVEPALRTTYLHTPDRLFLLPQIYLTYSNTSHSLFKFSAGRHLQYVRMFDHENLLGQRQQFFALSNGKNIPPALGNNFMAGYSIGFDKIKIDIEGYVRTLSGALMHATKTPGARPSGNPAPNPEFILFAGKSRSFGSDLSLIFEHERHFSMLTYTLSKSENSFPQLFKGQYFPSPEDSRHQLKWLYNYSAKRFDMSFTYSGATGRPYLDLSDLKNNVNRENLNLSNFIKNLRDYHRVDLGAGYTLYPKGVKTRIGFSVFNVLNRVNASYQQFLFQIPGSTGPMGNNENTILGSEVSQLERTWNLSVQFAFQDF